MPNDIQKIKELKQLYQNVFESVDGKKVLEHLENKLFIKRSTLNSDSLRMAFNEGQRSVVLHIRNMMNIDIEATEKLIEQQQKELGENDNVE